MPSNLFGTESLKLYLLSMISASSSLIIHFHFFSEKRKKYTFNFEKMKFWFEQANTQHAKLHSILEGTLNQKFIFEIIHTYKLISFYRSKLLELQYYKE